MFTKEYTSKLISSIPDDVEGQDLRAAYSVITGYQEGKSHQQIASYYAIDIEEVEKWSQFFKLNNNSKSEPTSARKRGRKSKDIGSYIKSNIGRVMTPKDVAKEVGISLPTFYNFYNSNRSLFKKTKRGEFQIVDASQEDM